jgi:hypothetical protein
VLHIRRSEMGDMRPSDLLGAVEVFKALYPSPEN